MKPVALFATAAVLCACNPVIERDVEVEALVQEPPFDARPQEDAPDPTPPPTLREEPVLAGVEPDRPTPQTVQTVAVADIIQRQRRRERARARRPSRDELWDLDGLPQNEAEATGLLRIWTSEIELANERDMIGIWQVVQNVRARHCNNSRYSSRVTRRITQCRTATGVLVTPEPGGEIPNAEETYLSAMRRLSQRALGVVPARSARGRWIREVTLDCEAPESWNRRRRWDSVMGPRCRRYAPLARALIDGTEHRRISRASLIAWGGRCERHCDNPADPSTCRQTGACDDAIACRRRLARVPNTGTGNAFWCRPGTRGCPSTVDPICRVFGISVETQDPPEDPPSEDQPSEESSVPTDLTREVSAS